MVERIGPHVAEFSRSSYNVRGEAALRRSEPNPAAAVEGNAVIRASVLYDRHLEALHYALVHENATAADRPRGVDESLLRCGEVRARKDDRRLSFAVT
jgi:hypothetical protein